MARYVIALLLAATPAFGQPCCECIPCTSTPTPTATATFTSPPATATFTRTPTLTDTATFTPGSITPLPGGLPIWAIRAGGSSVDVGTVVRAAPDGTIFTAGYFSGTTDFGTGPIVSAGVDIYLAKYTAAGFLIWMQHTGSSSTNIPWGLALDHGGNVILTGQFGGTLNFGCGPLTSILPDTSDIFVAKLSAAGTCLWSHRYGSGGDDIGASVAIDTTDHILLTGTFVGNVTFSGSLADRLWGSNNGSGNTSFVLKLNPDGTYVWSRAFSQTQSNNGPDSGMGIAVDSGNNVLVTGFFQGTEYFTATGMTSIGLSEDIYLVKYDPTGTLLWVRAIGGTGFDRGYAVAIDNANNAAITGYFAGTVDFGTGHPIAATGPLNAYVASYDPMGAPRWAVGITGSGVNQGMAIAADDGSLIATGQFASLTTFGPAPGVTVPSQGGSDIFIAKYNGSGGLLWAHGYGGTSGDIGYSVATDPTHAISGTGYFQRTMTVGTTGLVSQGSLDIDLLKLAP